MKKHSTIFLLGFMASGKSSLGKGIATALESDFIDLDDWISRKEGRSISEIFKIEGEPYFRQAEQDALKSIGGNENNLVVALGGGTPCYENNMELIKAAGTSIYLNIEPAVLIGRLRAKRNTRPLVANLSDEEISFFVHNTLIQRESYYRQADFILQENNPKVSQVLDFLT